jgi:hypothetical protein
MKNLFSKATGIVQKGIFLPLLAFLLIFTVDKILLKFAGIALIYLLCPDFRFRKDTGKVPMFYPLLVALEILKFLLLNNDFSTGHWVSFLLGSLFWIISYLAMRQMQLIVDQVEKEKIDRTLILFFSINAVISLIDLLWAIYRSGSPNPYNFNDPNFGNSTGDLIKGIFNGPSFLNMMINSFFLFLFLTTRRYWLALTAFLVILLTTSNFANLVLLPVLIAFVITAREKLARVWAAILLVLLPAFYFVVAPSNFRYLTNSIFVPKKQQQEMIAYEKQAILRQKEFRRKRSGHTLAYSASNVDSMLSLQLDSMADSAVAVTGKLGKLQSLKETAQYIASGPKPLIFGAGMGCFSSFLALRMSDANREEGSRLFQHLPLFISGPFRENHYKIFKAIYSLPREFHSVKHFPNSFINQLFGEYGLMGVALFLLTYVWFFVRRYRQLSYGRYLLFLLGGYLMFDYLFEYLSVVTVFELLVFLDLRRSKDSSTADPLKAKVS